MCRIEPVRYMVCHGKYQFTLVHPYSCRINKYCRLFCPFRGIVHILIPSKKTVSTESDSQLIELPCVSTPMWEQYFRLYRVLFVRNRLRSTPVNSFMNKLCNLYIRDSDDTFMLEVAPDQLVSNKLISFLRYLHSLTYQWEFFFKSISRSNYCSTQFP